MRSTHGSYSLFRRLPRCGSFVLIVIALMGIPGQSVAQTLSKAERIVQGRVIDTNEEIQPNAVVYLENQKSMEIKTYITAADGRYRFGSLSSDVDYQVWAQYEGRKSKVKTISSFDNKKQFNIDLKIDTSKAAQQ